ncbi:hypothetical protein K490DRAFT_65224 [Saccharata proteae CBS 121410]|uniref:Uncharacterized protein n=1 Tax=Saccharata proteae CBS 121410 TaxID=1314787 RepID=A0A9P4LXQ7_9PEZI|nr:hypothetical protein K490DRAFT_65224 [Saccharata proteae CBS 121410]
MTTFATANRSNDSLLPSHASTKARRTSTSRRALSYLKSSFHADETTTDPTFVAHRAHRAANPSTTLVTVSDPTFSMRPASKNYIETRTDPSFTALRKARDARSPNSYVETRTDPSFTALKVRTPGQADAYVETRSDPTFAMARAHREAHPERRVERRTDPSFTMLDGGRRFNC